MNPAAVLLAALAVCLVTAALAALLLVAERFLANYGPCRIDVNAGARKLDVRGGQTLLAALKNAGVFLPSACGGRGTCAYCKVKVSSGGGPVAPTETPLLTAGEVAADVRISCQLKVRGDMAVFVPEELLAVREYRGRVEKIRDLTHDVKELTIRLIEPGEIDFAAGQYVQLQVGGEPVWRAYSISSPPQVRDAIELIIRLVPGGICTTWVFTKLREGDEVRFTGPYGSFGLSDGGGGMVWIAGGSGMAPFWSMVRDMQRRGLRRRCTYFFGAVAARDLFLLRELKQLESQLDWLRFVPALSRPAEGDDWSGQVGLITEVVARHVPDAADVEAYLCGSPGMIDAAVTVLRRKGIGEGRVFFDKFA